MSLFLPSRAPALDENGQPLEGATWTFYYEETLTPAAINGGETSITSDSAGAFPDASLAAGISYRAILRDADGREILDAGSITTDLFSPFAKSAVVGGAIEAGATWNFYTTGTTTPQAVYADSDISVSLGSSVPADAAGRFPDIYLNSAITYKAVLESASGVVLDTIDPVTADSMAEYLATYAAGSVFVDKAAGDNADTGGINDPYQTLIYAYTNTTEGLPIYAKRAQTHALPKANQQWGNSSGSGVERPFRAYGSGVYPLLDARNDLSGLTWTSLSGNAWQTTVTFQDTPALNGLGDSNTKFALWLDDETGAQGGTLLTWKVGGADATANETEVIANAGSWAIAVGSEGDIRTIGGTHTTATITVHLPDSSDPNGADLRLSDRNDIAIFYGGTHGDVALIGGSSKDSWHSYGLGGVIPTFENITVIGAPTHAGVGPKNITGTFTAVGQPSPGTINGDNWGFTDGAGLHLYTAVDYTTQNISIGSFDVSDFKNGLYAHGSANNGYNKITVTNRSTIDNCLTAIKFDAGATVGTGFLSDGLYLNGGVDITTGYTAFSISDEPNWYINGGSFTASASQFANRATLFDFTGSGNTVTVKDFTFSMPVPGGAPNYAARTLYRWAPYYGHGSSPTPPTLILDNVQDVTPISLGDSQFKAGFYSHVVAYPNECRAHLDLRNGTTLGSMYNSSNGGGSWTGTFPESLRMEADCTIGFGTLDWDGFETAMTALGRYYYIEAGAKLVDREGTLIDTASTTLEYAVDATAPTLSSPTDIANGTTAGTLSVTTDEGNGTLYWVVTQSTTAPSAAQVIAGTDHTDSAADASGNQAVSATGVQNVSATGLVTATNYYSYFVHRDAVGNTSTVAAADGFNTTISLGSELVTNGGFDTDSDWNKGTGWTISGGKGVATSVPAFADIDQAVAIVNGTDYYVSIDVTVTSGSASLYMGASGNAAVQIPLTASGTYTDTITATATAAVLIRAESGGFTGSIDNVSIKEVL